MLLLNYQVAESNAGNVVLFPLGFFGNDAHGSDNLGRFAAEAEGGFVDYGAAADRVLLRRWWWCGAGTSGGGAAVEKGATDADPE